MKQHTTAFSFSILLVAATLVASPLLAAQHEQHTGARVDPAPQPAAPYLLDTDPVSGEKLGAVASLVIVEHEGRELRFNSEASAKAFRTEPARYLAAVDGAIVRQQLALYALDTCLVSGEKLGGSMGAAIDHVYGNRLIRFCCKGCLPKFEEDPDSYLAKLDAAVVATQLPTYPLKTCVVSGEDLGGSMGDPIDHVMGNRLVRLCCKGCKKDLLKDPLKALHALDEAGSARSDHSDHEHGEGRHAGGGGDDGHDHDGHR